MATSATERRSQYKRPRVESQNPETSMELPCGYTATCPADSTMKDDNDPDIMSSGCSTPRAERFRIPETSSCPPAPKKRRVTSNCSSKRSPIAFVAPPDIELFFFFAFRNISA